MWNDYDDKEPLGIDSDSWLSGPLLGWLVGIAFLVLVALQ